MCANSFIIIFRREMVEKKNQRSYRWPLCCHLLSGFWCLFVCLCVILSVSWLEFIYNRYFLFIFFLFSFFPAFLWLSSLLSLSSPFFSLSSVFHFFLFTLCLLAYPSLFFFLLFLSVFPSFLFSLTGFFLFVLPSIFHSPSLPSFLDPPSFPPFFL